jgi:hypothetical protein
MADVGVVASTASSKLDTGILVEDLDDSSNILCGTRLNNTCWIYTTQCRGPVLLCLVLILEGKKPRSQHLAWECTLDVDAGLGSGLVGSRE